jgi:hypothetical protein
MASAPGWVHATAAAGLDMWLMDAVPNADSRRDDVAAPAD